MRRYTRWCCVIVLGALCAVGSPALAQNLLEPVEVAVSRAMQQAARVPMRGAVGLGASLQVPGGALARAVAAQVPLYPAYPENTFLTQRLVQYKHNYFLPDEQLGGVFLARRNGAEGPNAFSGAVVKTVYNGKEEIYGVIASHTIAKHEADPALEPTFTADVYIGGRFFSVPAEIVQVSSPGVLDLALVKFPTNIEPHLHPFELETREMSLGENLRTMGFAGYVSFGTIWPIYLSDRSLINKTSLYLRADMWLKSSQRSGLCGGPIWDRDGHLVGIHTGTTDGKTEDSPREAHATRATFVNTLLDAYHNSGKATVPFELNGQKIVDLEINEAVSYVELLDEDEEVLWEWDVSSKFPYRKVEQKILEHQPRYVDLTTSVVNWEGNVLVSRTKHKFGSVSYRYDLLTGQTVRYDKNFWER